MERNREKPIKIKDITENKKTNKIPISTQTGYEATTATKNAKKYADSEEVQ